MKNVLARHGQDARATGSTPMANQRSAGILPASETMRARRPRSLQEVSLQLSEMVPRATARGIGFQPLGRFFCFTRDRIGALRARHSAGFTIVELLVAMAISMMIVGLLLVVSGHMLGDYDLIQGRARMEADADFAIDMIASDLMTLSIPNKGEGLRAVPETVPAATTNAVTNNAQWLVFLGGTFDKDTNHPRSVRAVSYRMACQNPVDGSSGSQVYGLYRTLADATDTFSNVIGSTDLRTNSFCAGTNSTQPKNFLIGNVVAFSTRFLIAGTTNWTDPTSQTNTIDRDSANIIVGTTNAVPGGFTRAEVTVTVLTPKGAKLLSDGAIKMSNATSPSNRYSHSYSRQVSILPGARK